MWHYTIELSAAPNLQSDNGDKSSKYLVISSCTNEPSDMEVLFTSSSEGQPIFVFETNQIVSSGPLSYVAEHLLPSKSSSVIRDRFYNSYKSRMVGALINIVSMTSIENFELAASMAGVGDITHDTMFNFLNNIANGWDVSKPSCVE